MCAERGKRAGFTALADDLSRSGCSRVLDVTSPHMHAQARVLTCDDVTFIVSDLIPRAWDCNYIALLRSAHILLSLGIHHEMFYITADFADAF